MLSGSQKHHNNQVAVIKGGIEMRKGLKGLSLSLCAMLLLAGCSCKKDEDDNSVKADIKDGSSEVLSGLKEDTKKLTLQNLYDDLKATYGNEVAADKLIEIIADAEITDEWVGRYAAKIEEKMMELDKKESFFFFIGKF